MEGAFVKSDDWKAKPDHSRRVKKKTKNKKRKVVQILFQQPDQNEDLFLKLPAEIILQIFSNLSHNDLMNGTTLVNRRFRTISLDPKLWRSVDLSRLSSTTSFWSTKRLLSRCKYLKKLVITDRLNCSEQLAIHALKRCKRLEQLDLVQSDDVDQYACVSSSLISTIGNHGSALYRLRTEFDWNYMFLALNGECLRNITHLELDNFVLNRRSIKVIANHCSRLERFRGPANSSMEDAPMNYFIEKAHKTLKSLDINGWNLSDVSMENLGKCQLLQSLEIHRAFSLQRGSLLSISQLPNLTRLSISFAHCLRPQDFIIAFNGSGFAKLTSLGLPDCHFGLNDSTVMWIVANCIDLDSFDLKGCYPRLKRGTLKHMTFLNRDLKISIDVATPNIFERSWDRISDYIHLLMEDYNFLYMFFAVLPLLVLFCFR